MAMHARKIFPAAAVLAVVCSSAAMPLPRANAAPLASTWQGVPLADVAAALAPLLGRPLVVDCRVDPTTPITLAAEGLSPTALLEAVAEQSGGEVVILRESVRLAPPGRRAALQAAEERRLAELAEAESTLRAGLRRRTQGGWPPAASPREIVTTLVEDAGGTLSGLERIPHDQLRGLALPAVSRAAQLDLVLAGYDLRAAITASGVEVVRLDPTARPERPPRLTPPPQPPAGMAGDSTVFTLEAAAPLQQLLEAICAQTGLTLRIDQPALKQSGITLNAIVRVSVRDASRAELLDAIAQPLGLRWQINDGVLSVTAGLPPTAGDSADGEPRRD